MYMGSFWDAPLKKEGRENLQLLSREKNDLLSELNMLPRQVTAIAIVMIYVTIIITITELL